ncbi:MULTISPECIES: NAD-dependent epimerase/dehydratase family protein [Arthrobacter]|uniref:Epimerase n=1 Tax=Arthrobacter sunyaminii TaxID=2816859 RepID=A0A975S4Z6_9MICC|nr:MULTISPECIES: NAD-dependent epimerase/dehydratase family protein [Arthrobacter]MBO0907588.1 epimerase [Arthrobacter sunyaminii]QWQ35156.1 epimerase [Arthrobacter sunyaminii]
MRILILGGTRFLSREVARQAVARGHDVTCLARGESGPPVTGADFVRADRDAGASAYEELDGVWDAVIDVARKPQQVQEALAALSGRSSHWSLVSTASVYASNDTPGEDENAALVPALKPVDGVFPDPADNEYGAGKVACEELVWDLGPGNVLVTRPGLIAGPEDESDRFGYWPARVAQERSPVLIPDMAETMTQTIDVRDLALWLVTGAEDNRTGTYNTMGPSVPFGELLTLSTAAAGYHGSFRTADPQWLHEQGVAYWAGNESLPLWMPEGYEGFSTRSNAAAVAAGLELRPVEHTVRDVLTDEEARGLHRERKSGLSAARETSLLAALDALGSTGL